MWLLEHAFEEDGRKWPPGRQPPKPRVHVTVVEPFDYVRKDMAVPATAEDRNRFAANLRPHVKEGGTATVTDRSYADALMVLASARPRLVFDAIAIDARGNSRDALEAMVLAWQMVRRGGGVLSVSNYTHSLERDARCPRRGIDAFMDAYSDDLRVLATQWHVFMARLARPRTIARCASEFFPIDDDDDDEKNAPMAVVRRRRIERGMP